ncbi:MAG: MmcQ/YjbR family DNA-binding protein [Gammaproteobacteria bacterium]|nr:MmcQ/YjbR family DNA-binding protein [Gammaproteobacteria bacterium]
MNGKQARAYLKGKPESFEDFPFGPDVYVYKIVHETKGKMFATLGYSDDIARMNLKCDPEEAMALRDIFEAVVPGYHMNKAHWNTVILDGSIPTGEIERMIDRSFGLVVKGMKRAERQALEIRHGTDTIYR